MAYRNDSSQMKACLQQGCSDTKNNDGEDQSRPEQNLIDLEGTSSTSFENPTPSAACSTAGSGSGSGCSPRSGDLEEESKAREHSRMMCVPLGSPPGTSKPQKASSASCTQWGESKEPAPERSDTPSWSIRRAWECGVRPGQLKYSADHTVMINVNVFARDQSLITIDGRPQWDSFHVKMPHAHENIFIKSSFLTNEKQARWSAISKHLKKLQSGSPTVADVEKAIKSYNPKYEHSWSFAGLQNYVQTVPRQESILSTLIPKMAELALRLPEDVPRAIPHLKQGRSHSITLSQRQIAALLANAFFCTFPRRNDTKKNAEYANYPTINFSSLFGNPSKTTVEKLRAILHYFSTVTGSCPSGLVTFERCCIPDARLPNWRERTELLGNVEVRSEGTIEEEGAGMLQVDFACSLVGGGVLSSGLVQEEILFLMNPELIVARLFTEKLNDNECLKVTGSQQYSDYSGYRSSFEWRAPHHESLRRDDWKRLHRQIVAIDALNFRHPKEQYCKHLIRRELNKAFIGFSEKSRSPNELPTIATGNWGCGAFNGDPILKALIQMMAAAVARRDLMFFTFRDKNLERRLRRIFTLLKDRKVTVGDIYTMLDFVCHTPESHRDLYHYILTYMNSSSSL